jgi:hypothetical protein
MFHINRFDNPYRVSLLIAPVFRVMDEWYFNKWKIFKMPLERAKRDDV